MNTSTIEVASYQAIFNDINKPVQRDYEDRITGVYEANLFPVNFDDVYNTVNQINGEIKKATRGLIPIVIEPYDLKDAGLLMMSALYFKGKWKVRNQAFL